MSPDYWNTEATLNVLMVVLGVVPFHTGGGVAMVNWAILHELRSRGHKVMVATQIKNPVQEHMQAVADIGAGLLVYEGNQLDLGSCPDFTPDVIFCYTSSAIQQCSSFLPSIPRVCSLVDLDHLISLYRRQYYARSQPLTYIDIVGHHQQAMAVKDSVIPLLQTCHSLIEHAAHHNKWLNEIAGVNCTYIPMPVIDHMFLGWVRDIRTRPVKTYTNPTFMPRITLAGHLAGVATLSGLYFLAEDVLPNYKDDPKVRFFISGAEGLFHDLATRMRPYVDNGWVTLQGYLPDIQKEMMNSNVVLVPTPIDLGFRTRIVEAWSLGCCVITHPANLLGMPEAKVGENILAPSTGKEMAEMVREVAWDVEVQQKIGQEARKSYEEHYKGSESKVVDLIEQAVEEPVSVGS